MIERVGNYLIAAHPQVGNTVIVSTHAGICAGAGRKAGPYRDPGRSWLVYSAWLAEVLAAWLACH